MIIRADDPRHERTILIILFDFFCNVTNVITSTMRQFHIHIELVILFFGTGVVRCFRVNERRFPSPSSPYRRSERYWSKQAFVEDKRRAPVLGDPIQWREGVLVELSSPRLWLESQPDGVYTVMRSDLFISQDERPWRLWGVDFHMERLRESYSKLYGSNDSDLATAIHESTSITGCLLAETFCAVREIVDLSEPGSTCVVMLTLLWYPMDDSSVGVRGHVFTSGETIEPRARNIIPIRAALALETNEASIPNRKDNFPDCKQSSWCNTRRPLEERYKTDVVGEVLLTDNTGDVPMILEVR